MTDKPNRIFIRLARNCTWFSHSLEIPKGTLLSATLVDGSLEGFVMFDYLHYKDLLVGEQGYTVVHPLEMLAEAADG